MARVIALAFSQSTRRKPQFEVLRVLIVCGCALALIAVRHPLPF